MIRAAGILFVAGDTALFLRRGNGADHPNEWAIPGGKLEGDETLEEGAIRETYEEAGVVIKESEMAFWTRNLSPAESGTPAVEGQEPALPEDADSIFNDSSAISDGQEEWITIKGSRVLVGEDGNIKAGAGGKFNGQKRISSVSPKEKPKMPSPQVQKELVGDLNSKLKSISGGRVKSASASQAMNDPDLSLILEKGKNWDKAQMAPGNEYLGNEGECHWNTAKLFRDGKIKSIVVGYAKNFEGWHQHTWGLKEDGSIVETTRSNTINSDWFGAPLGAEDSKNFAEHVLNEKNVPGQGNVRSIKGGHKIRADESEEKYADSVKIQDEVDFTTFMVKVSHQFTPKLCDEHDGWAWAPLTAPPQPIHPGVQVALERFSMDELGVARAISENRLTSPQRYENVWLFAIRITGTGVSYRHARQEFVWRDPSIYINEEFLARCNGLAVIWEHPEKSLLNDKEFSDRVIGSIMLPYIPADKPDEVWGIAKVYDAEAAKEMRDNQMSTSPAVNFADPTENDRVTLEDGKVMLIEGKPSLLDHIAICANGVWDKGGDPTGVESIDAIADSQGPIQIGNAKPTPRLGLLRVAAATMALHSRSAIATQEKTHA